MSDRSRRARRQISDTPDEQSDVSATDSGDDYESRKIEPSRRGGRYEAPTSRARRSGDETKQSIRLTMKVAPSKLREVMRANEVDSLHDTLGGGQVIDGPRSRRTAPARTSGRGANRPRYTEYGESEIDEDENDENGAEAEDDMNDFDEVGAEAEGGTDEEDVEMEDAPPARRPPNPPKPPKITLKAPPKAEAQQGVKTRVIVKPPNVGPLKSVEEQEMDDEEDEGEDEDEDEDEADESSELSEDEDEDVTNMNEEDAEGEEDEAMEDDAGDGLEAALDEDADEDDEEDDDLDDSGDETPASGMGTPDPGKMTKRQRGRPEDQGQLLALDMAPQQRKFFTDEEKAMKKDEHARKRKELTKRKILEEKTAALNRLLKPQASKARGAAPKPETLAAATAAAAAEGEEMVEKANPLYTRWVSTKDGVRLGVPEEWLGKRLGQAFGPPPSSTNPALVQELD